MRRFLFALIAVLCTATPLLAENITLAWDANTEPDLAGYVIEYGPAGAPFTTRVDVGNHTTWTLTGAAAATTYVFHVLAYNADGIESAPSNDVSWTTALPPGGCTTPDPFVALGGGTCYNGGWLPPGITPPSSTPPPPPPTPAATPTPPPASSSGCATPDPFSAIGGGTCYNGGWLPPGIPVPGNAPAPPPPPPPTPPPASTPPPPPVTTAGCATPDPFTAIGGGTCYNGGWLPPGITPPSGASAPPPSTPPPATPPPSTPPPAPTTTSQTGCSTPDPFAAIPGLIGACRNGGWIPAQFQTGTVRLISGTWAIVGDNGTTYLPSVTLQPAFQQDGLRVSFAGVTVTVQIGGTLMDIVAIGAA